MLKRYGKGAVSHQAGNCTQRRQNYYLHCVSLGIKEKNVFCFIANPVTNMLWFIFKSILILLPCGGVFFLFDLCIKEMNFFFFNLDSCSNHSNDPNHSITPSSESEYLKLYPDFRNQLLSVLAASIFLQQRAWSPSILLCKVCFMQSICRISTLAFLVYILLAVFSLCLQFQHT